MASARRIEKINTLVREVVADILSRDFQFPEGVLVTVTRVEASEDLYYGRVFVSVLGREPGQEETALEYLAHRTAAVQRELNRRLGMRPVPKIHFETDQQEQRRERVEKLLSENQGIGSGV